MPSTQGTVYIVDDDSSVRTALKRLLSLVGLHAEAYESVDAFVKTKKADAPSCLVLDVRLPGMSGLEFQDELSKEGMNIPIIFITAQGDSPMTRRAMKAGAVDFLTKPFRKKELLAAIAQGLERDRARREESASMAELQERLDQLTPRETEVMRLVTTGMLNKQIGETLGLTEATVKIHRRRVMQKMQVNSLAQLVLIAEKIKRSK
jgi:RNA polymerase sigma factor (sigma-70 family)